MDKKHSYPFPPRKVWIKTFGCQMNQHDSQRLYSHLKDINFQMTSNRHEADLILINTCAIRDLANSKFYSQLGEIKKVKKEKKNLIVGVGGCVAQIEAKQLIKRFTHLDFVFGTDAVDQIGDFIYRIDGGERKFVFNKWDRRNNYSIETKIITDTPRAFVNIIKGCNKYCSYCIVPYTRGKERSRKIREVVQDISRLVEYRGIEEVTLLGQNVNSYGHDNKETLAQLIVELDKIEGLRLIRYTTSHPYDVSDELIAVHGNIKKLSPHLHLPVQSGSNTVLQRMLREYTVEHYTHLCSKLKKARADMVLSTDIIVGFPGETNREYEETLSLLDHVQFDFIYSFVYSPRPGTKAVKISCPLDQKTKKKRLHHLQRHQLAIQKKIRSSLVGKSYNVLVEDKNTKNGIVKWQGRTPCNRLVHFRGKKEDNYLWKWIDVNITSATALSCQGRPETK